MSAAALTRIRAALARRPDELRAARRRGQKVVAWFGYNVPEELIYACDMIPIRLAWGGDNRLAELGANYISTQSCFFLRQSTGLLAEGTNPYLQQLDALISDTTCTQLQRVASLFGHFFNLPAMQIGFPKDPAQPASRRYFLAEVQHLAERLEALSGVRLDESRLAAAIRLYRQIAETTRELFRRAAAPDCALAWTEVLAAVRAGQVLDRAQYLALLQELLHESPARGLAKTSRPRVLLAGSPIVCGDDKLIDLIQNAGAEIVGDLLWSGSANYVDFDYAGSSLADLAAAYLDRLPHAALPCMELASDRRLLALRELAQTTQADGIVYYSLRYCDAFSFKLQATKDWMKQAGVKVMEAQTDYGAMDTETLRTRVEAFVEMLAAHETRSNVAREDSRDILQ